MIAFITGISLLAFLIILAFVYVMSDKVQSWVHNSPNIPPADSAV